MNSPNAFNDDCPAIRALFSLSRSLSRTEQIAEHRGVRDDQGLDECERVLHPRRQLLPAQVKKYGATKPEEEINPQ